MRYIEFKLMRKDGSPFLCACKFSSSLIKMEILRLSEHVH